MDVRQDWVAELAEIWHTATGADAVDASRQAPVLDYRFSDLEARTIDWSQPMVVDDLSGLVTTRSYYLAAPTAEQQSIRADMTAFLARTFGSRTEVELPYRTHCFRARLRAES